MSKDEMMNGYEDGAHYNCTMNCNPVVNVSVNTGDSTDRSDNRRTRTEGMDASSINSVVSGLAGVLRMLSGC
ncbi:MAG: hypothetical protein NC548_29775 [Lachnospiraceae bacterium]|nr:hypothetical protein [Lachnospiraceae bacterium]